MEVTMRPLQPCSVVRGYIRPSNYALIKNASVVVRAEAVNFSKDSEGKGGWAGIEFGTFTFNVLERTQGAITNTTLDLHGDTGLRFRLRVKAQQVSARQGLDAKGAHGLGRRGSGAPWRLVRDRKSTRLTSS